MSPEILGLLPEKMRMFTQALALAFGDTGQIELDADATDVDSVATQISEQVHTHGVQPEPASESKHKILDHLRDDAVGDGKEPVTDAYAGSHPDTPVETDPSKIMQAARALADQYDFSPAKREAFLEFVQNNQGKLTLGTIENGTTIIMADGAKGGYNANTFEVQLPDMNRDVFTGTFRYEENGVVKEETVFIFNDCANPAVDASEDKIVEEPVIVPPADPCEAGVVTSVDERVLVGEKSGETVAVAVITRENIKPDELWEDDGDGKSYQGRSYDTLREDSGDTFFGRPDEAQIEKDLQAYEDKYHYRPKYLVYNMVDCNGKSVVQCYDVSKGKWSVFLDRTWHPDGQKGIDGPVIDTKEELEAYLESNKVKPKGDVALT